jgi:hypothetical protein
MLDPLKPQKTGSVQNGTGKRRSHAVSKQDACEVATTLTISRMIMAILLRVSDMRPS